MIGKLRTAAVKRALQSAAADGARASAEKLLETANKRVPYQTGRLMRSGHVVVEGTTARVVYDAPYAVSVHENMAMSHSGGRTAKWLEHARNGVRGELAETAAESMRRKLS